MSSRLYLSKGRVRGGLLGSGRVDAVEQENFYWPLKDCAGRFNGDKQAALKSLRE